MVKTKSRRPVPVRRKGIGTLAPRAAPRKSRLFRSSRDVVVLSLMEFATMYGQQVHDEYCWVTGEQLHPTAIYPALRRLMLDGLIRDVRVSEDTDNRRVYWEITSKGVQRLRQFRHACLFGRRQ
jgi:DNA-binding PadR family transcriptional regulator